MNITAQVTQKSVGFLKRKVDALFPPFVGDRYYCPLCKTDLAFFLPFPFHYFREMHENLCIHSIFQAETLNLEHYSCPSCSASDRDRLYCLYVKKILENGAAKKIDLLEIAPAPQLQKFLKQHPRVNHRSADVSSPYADDLVDITNMQVYREGQFDAFICSHVLEHVENDEKALQELYRILKPNGWGIVMVPILLNLNEDYENKEITSDADRWKHFGQNDHVRVYSKNGFTSKLANAGFHVSQLGNEYFGRDEFERSGIHFRSVLYVVNKP